MGKHVRRFLYLPPGAKPRYRFVVALSTIVLIAFAAMVAVAALYPENGPAAAQPAERVSPLGDAPGRGPTPRVSTDPGPAATGALTGVYSVPANWVWQTGFQAQVAITNHSPTSQAWQVQLSYPPTVTGFVGSWVEGAPAPINEVYRQQLTISGGQAVAPGQTVSLKVQFDKAQGSGFAVQQCVVNGTPCIAG